MDSTSRPQVPAEVIQAAAGSVYINGEKYPLPRQVIDNIETVLSLQAKQIQTEPPHERALHRVAALFGTSGFLFAQLTFFATWIFLSQFAPELLPFDLPPYDLQSQGLDTAALLITTGVLVRQSHQEKLAEERSHLMLQINLLTEQKTAKTIALLEELRADLPGLVPRLDWEAEIMKQATDPKVVLDILKENLEAASAEDLLDR